MTAFRGLLLLSSILLTFNLPIAITSLHTLGSLWLLLSIAVTNLALIQLFLILLLNIRFLVLITGPMLVALAASLAVTISEVFVQKGSWLSIYYLAFMTIITNAYTFYAKVLYVNHLSDFSYYLSPWLKTFTLLPLMMCSFGAPTYSLMDSIFNYPDQNPLIWAAGASIGFFLFQLTIFSAVYTNIKHFGVINPKSHFCFNIICLIHLFLYSPTAVYLIVALLRNSSFETTKFSVVCLLFNFCLLGLTILPGSVFTAIHGYRYIKYVFLTRYRGMELPWFYNRSIFAFYNGPFVGQGAVEDEENGEEHGGSPLLTVKYKGCAHQTECCICLEEFKEGDMLIAAEECNHMYHSSCMAKWRDIRNTCPKCRTKVKRIPETAVHPEEAA